MRDVLDQIEAWEARGQSVALATVVSTWGSAPRPVGSKLAISGDELAGSVSGGCIEGAVVEAARSVLAEGGPRLERFGVADETAWSVGLSCGGTIEILIERVPGPTDDGREPEQALRRAVREEHLVARAVRLGGPDLGRSALYWPDGSTLGDLGVAGPETDLAGAVERAFSTFSGQRARQEAGDEDLFVDVHPPRPRLVIVGAVHAAIHLVAFAHRLGFSTHVVDPRTAFATADRFDAADSLSHDWPDQAVRNLAPDEGTYVVTLSHDPKLDLPALEVALRSQARYIGALGSKRTHAKRSEALRARGFTAAQLGRLHAPVGLDLGGRRAEEIALAVMAEIVAVSHGIGRRPPP